MQTVLYHKIIAKTKEICGDYNELRSDYCSAISSLKINENIVKIFHLESLLKEKNHIECAYALKKGFDLEKKDIQIERLNKYEELFEKGFDETIGVKDLYASEQYRKLKSEIDTAWDEVRTSFENDTEAIDKLFEAYSNYNYELVRAAYIIGCEIKQYSKLIRNTHI